LFTSPLVNVKLHRGARAAQRVREKSFDNISAMDRRQAQRHPKRRGRIDRGQIASSDGDIWQQARDAQNDPAALFFQRLTRLLQRVRRIDV
jgi:hypothetical protein